MAKSGEVAVWVGFGPQQLHLMRKHITRTPLLAILPADKYT